MGSPEGGGLGGGAAAPWGTGSWAGAGSCPRPGDPARRTRAKVPEEVGFQAKPELAIAWCGRGGDAPSAGRSGAAMTVVARAKAGTIAHESQRRLWY